MDYKTATDNNVYPESWRQSSLTEDVCIYENPGFTPRKEDINWKLARRRRCHAMAAPVPWTASEWSRSQWEHVWRAPTHTAARDGRHVPPTHSAHLSNSHRQHQHLPIRSAPAADRCCVVDHINKLTPDQARLLPTPAASITTVTVGHWACVSVCPCSKRKTARAINTKVCKNIVPMTSVGLLVDMTAEFFQVLRWVVICRYPILVWHRPLKSTQPPTLSGMGSEYCPATQKIRDRFVGWMGFNGAFTQIWRY